MNKLFSRYPNVTLSSKRYDCIYNDISGHTLKDIYKPLKNIVRMLAGYKFLV